MIKNFELVKFDGFQSNSGGRTKGLDCDTVRYSQNNLHLRGDSLTIGTYSHDNTSSYDIIEVLKIRCVASICLNGIFENDLMPGSADVRKRSSNHWGEKRQSWIAEK